MAKGCWEVRDGMRTIPCFSLVVLCLSPASCESFEPYDYEKNKDARFKLEDSDCSIGVHGKKFYLMKEFGELKKDDKK